MDVDIQTVTPLQLFKLVHGSEAVAFNQTLADPKQSPTMLVPKRQHLHGNARGNTVMPYMIPQGQNVTKRRAQKELSHAGVQTLSRD